MQQTQALPSDVVVLAEEIGLGDRLYSVMDATREMYDGPISVAAAFDPESPEDRWITFYVEDGREIQRSIDWQLEWHRRVFELIPDCPGTVCLSVMPQ